MKKLSKAQAEMLKRIAQGDRIFFLGGLKPHFFYTDEYKKLRWKTLFILSDTGYIVINYHVGKLHITKKGEEFVAQMK